jgi:hypothetical protein
MPNLPESGERGRSYCEAEPIQASSNLLTAGIPIDDTRSILILLGSRVSLLPKDDASSSAITRATAATSSPRHILPNDLACAIKRLEDRDLDRLLLAVLAEQKRRGKNVPASGKSPRNRQPVPITLKSGKLNAVRAAFKAGITPSRIARQFGISQSDVRKALTSDATKPRGLNSGTPAYCDSTYCRPLQRSAGASKNSAKFGNDACVSTQTEPGALPGLLAFYELRRRLALQDPSSWV